MASQSTLWALRAAAVAAVVAAAVVALTARSPASASSSVVEHKVVYLSFEDYKDTDIYKQTERDLKSTGAAVLRMHEIALGELGKQGWELVSVEGKTPAQAVFYLKRRP